MPKRIRIGLFNKGAHSQNITGNKVKRGGCKPHIQTLDITLSKLYLDHEVLLSHIRISFFFLIPLLFQVSHLYCSLAGLGPLGAAGWEDEPFGRWGACRSRIKAR